MIGAVLKPLAFGGSAIVKILTGSKPGWDTGRRKVLVGMLSQVFER